MSAYVEVPAEAIRKHLAGAGFELDWSASGREEVWVFRHKKDPSALVKVYTSVPKHGGAARARGKDAIRVCAVVGGKGVFKSARVYRAGTVEGVLERMMERAREAYARLNEILRRRAA